MLAHSLDRESDPTITTSCGVCTSTRQMHIAPQPTVLQSLGLTQRCPRSPINTHRCPVSHSLLIQPDNIEGAFTRQELSFADPEFSKLFRLGNAGQDGEHFIREHTLDKIPRDANIISWSLMAPVTTHRRGAESSPIYSF